MSLDKVTGSTPPGAIEARRRRKRAWVDRFHRHLANPLARRVAGYLPGQALIETTGRRSGRARHTPVGGRLDEHGTFWLVANHGRHAQYVRNIMVDPRVRVQRHGRWHPGVAHLLDQDDARRRLARPPAHNSAMVRLLGTALLTIRIDLDTPPGDGARP